MKLLAISGSARRASTNTALLRAIRHNAPDGISVSLFHEVHTLPVFSPDLEGEATPAPVLDFAGRIAAADGVLISSPEYVHAIPGGLKNAIDWLVSREEIIHKPIALVHASHRGDDMLAALRLVLRTISSGFNEDLFLRISLMSKTPEEVEEILQHPAHRQQMTDFLERFAAAIRAGDSYRDASGA